MQKEITLSEIKAVFTKDFQTFGKMDPFLVFSIGKSQGKTQTANDAGKQPSWKNSVILNYYDEPTIIVKAYEQDMSTNQFMGEGRIDVKALKNTGAIQFKISQQNSNVIGTISCKYSTKTLPPTPLLIVKNIRCDFYKQTKFLLKTKPYFSITCAGKSIVTEPKKQGNATYLSWDQSLRVKVKQGEKITFSVQDKNDQNKKIFGYDALIKEFRFLSGSKCFNVIDKNYEPLGTIQFDFETQNLVNKEQSVKNQQISKKQSNQMYYIVIQKIKGNLNKSGEDLYFKINIGPTMFKTQCVKNSKKDFLMEPKQTLYSDKKQNRIIFAAYDKDVTYDDFLGVGQLSVEGLTTGDKTVNLKNNTQNFGDIILSLTVKKALCKQITISDIKLKLGVSSDLIGKSDPYVNASIGGWSGRTQTVQGEDVSFKKNINLKFSEEKEILFQVFDQDVTNQELLYQQKINIEGFKDNGQQRIILKKQGAKDQKKNGQLYFKYTTKNVFIPPKKQDLKKSQKIIPAQQPKKVQAQAIQNKQPEKKQQKLNNQNESKIQQKPKTVDDKSKQDTINNSAINKSRSIKLPIIEDKRNYGDRIFNKQSASTLQKSIHVYSMPRGDRFGSGPKYSGQPSYYVQTCFKPNSGKGVGFGFGHKKQFPDWMQKNMKQNPAPGSYIGAHQNNNDIRPKGPTFGISHKYYEKVTIPKEKAYRSTERLNPIAGQRK